MGTLLLNLACNNKQSTKAIIFTTHKKEKEKRKSRNGKFAECMTLTGVVRVAASG